MIEVSELTEQEAAAYSEFLPREAVSAFYATLEFRNFLLDSVGGKPTYLVARRDDRIVGVLPLFTAHHPQRGLVVNSLPWYGSHGGCLLGDAADSEARDALLRAVLPRWTADDVAFGTVILSHAETEHASQYHALLRPDTTDTRTGQVTVLPADGVDLEARLEKVLLQKTRNLARKSLRQGFVLHDGDDATGWNYLVDTHHENLAALGGKAKPRAHFEALRLALPREWRRLLVATLEGTPVAALLLIRWGRTVEYLTPVISHAYRSRQPMSFLIWNGMVEAIRDGFTWWNWGGTWPSQESLFHFKAGWGAQSWPYQYLSRGRADALAAFRADAPAVMAAWPYYYVFPLHD
jgi:hypothetical protein